MGHYNNMKNKNIVKFIVFTTLILSGLLGATHIATVFHEYSHRDDFSVLKDNFIRDELCLWSVDTEGSPWDPSNYAGYYAFELKNNNEEIQSEISKINKYTEIKAYTISFLISGFYMFCVIYLVLYLDKMKDLESQNYILQNRLNRLNKLQGIEA